MLAKPVSPQSALPQAGTEFLAFTIGEEEYGIDIQRVQELRGYDHATRIANSPACLKGVINLRGIIVPITDMRIRLGCATPSYDQFTVVVVLNLGGRTVGMVVDGVSDVITLSADQIRPAPAMGDAPDAGYLTGIGTVADRMLILVDAERLLAADAAIPLDKLAA